MKKKKKRPPKPAKGKRTKKYAGPKSSGETSASSGGVLQSMVRGMKTVAGTADRSEKKKESLFSKIFWWALLLAAAAFAAYQLTK